MSFLKRKSFIITIIALLSVIGFSVFGVVLYKCINNTENYSQEVQIITPNSAKFTVETKKVDITSPEYEKHIEATATDSSVLNKFMKDITNKIVWSLATGETKFTISSQSDFFYYASASYYTVTDYSTPYVGAYYDGGFSINTYIYYKNAYPIDYYYDCVIPAGNYLVDWTTDGTQTWVTVPSKLEGWYQCELKLTKDITLDLSAIVPFYSFNGIFNGDGYTINCNNRLMVYEGCSGGLFQILKLTKHSETQKVQGSVKNLKVKNMDIIVETSGDDSYVGSIVGLNNGLISSCIVENCSFVSNRWKKNCYVAGLVGANISGTGSISDCMVKGKYLNGGWNDNGVLEDDGMYVYYLVAGTYNESEKKASPASSAQAINCVVDISWGDAEGEDGVYLVGESILPDEVDYDKTDVYNETLGSKNYNSTEGEFSSLSKSAVGGNSGTVWYYGGDRYNSGWPMLRVFIKSWKTIYFVVETEGTGTISPTSILIPSTGYDWDEFTNYGSTKRITILNQQITASPATGYSVASWEWDEDDTFTVMFAKATTYINFYTIGQVGMEGSSRYPVYAGTKVHVDIQYCKKATQDILVEVNPGVYDYRTVKCMKEITYTFATVDGSGTMGWVRFYIDYDKYNQEYVSDYFITQRDEKHQKDFNIGTTSEYVYVYGYLKEYNITFM